MEAVKTIGLGKSLRFVWFSIYSIILHCCFIPQLRVLLLRIAGATVGRGTVILDVTFINLHNYGFSRLKIGKKCFIGEESMLDIRGGIHLEDHVTVAGRVMLVSHMTVGYPDHPLQKKYPVKEQQIKLRRGSYIGTGAIILPGVTVGRECVIGAGAVVTRDVPDHTFAAGVPAKIIKKLI